MANHSFQFAPPQADWERSFAVVRRAAMGHYTRDAILGGLRARLFTDDLTLAEAWSEIFFGPQEWQNLVGNAPSPELALSLYAATLENNPPLAAINPVQSMGILLNQGGDHALVDAMAALAAPKLGEQLGWVVQGTSVAAGSRGVVVIGPEHAQVAAEIAGQADGHIAVQEPLLIRLTFTRQIDGIPLAPMQVITERGQEITGARVLQWLRRDADQEPQARVTCRTLDGRLELVQVGDLDLDQRPHAYAFPLTRAGLQAAQPPLVTDAVALIGQSLIAVLSLDAKSFVARLLEDQPWLPDQVVQEVAQAIECHAVGATWPPDQRLESFMREIATRLRRAKR